MYRLSKSPHFEINAGRSARENNKVNSGLLSGLLNSIVIKNDAITSTYKNTGYQQFDLDTVRV